MQEMVEQIHACVWEVCQKAELDIDPVMLRRSIGRHVSSALLVVSPESLQRIGPKRLAVMIDCASRYDLTLAEVLNEALQSGAERPSTLCREIIGRRQGTQRTAQRPALSLVK